MEWDPAAIVIVSLPAFGDLSTRPPFVGLASQQTGLGGGGVAPAIGCFQKHDIRTVGAVETLCYACVVSLPLSIISSAESSDNIHVLLIELPLLLFFYLL